MTTPESLLCRCARTSEWFSKLPDEVFAHLVIEFLRDREITCLVRACFPRARALSRWSHGGHEEYALGILSKPTHDATMTLEHLITLRGGLYLLSRSRGCNGRIERDCLGYQQDWRRVGRLFAAVRGQIFARDVNRPFTERLLGFHSLDEWHETLVDLLYKNLREDVVV